MGSCMGPDGIRISFIVPFSCLLCMFGEHFTEVFDWGVGGEEVVSHLGLCLGQGRWNLCRIPQSVLCNDIFHIFLTTPVVGLIERTVQCIYFNFICFLA